MASKNLQMDYEDYKQAKKGSLLNTKIGPYIIQTYIGAGAYGSVYRGIDDNTNKHVAVKVIDLAQIEKDTNERVRDIRRRLSKTESELMMVCDSPYILKCYEVFENKNLKIMIIQYCNGGTLEDEILNKKRIPEKEAINILQQIIKGLSQLHQNHIIHRDLKAENILVHNGIYKIADFGFSKMVLSEADIKHTTLGTIITMAPQIMKRLPYGLKVDIWSLGVIFYQMLVGQLPFEPMQANSMYEQIKNKKLFSGDKLVSKTVELDKNTTDLLKKMLTLRPEQRISFQQLITHPIFKGKGDQSLTSRFRLKQSLEGIKANKKLEGEVRNLEQEEQILRKSLEERSEISEPQKCPPKVIKVSPRDVEERKKGVDNFESKAYQWGLRTHWECLKTELMLTKIIIPLQQSKLLAMNRTDIEFMYLLSARCFFNLSPINEEVTKNKNKIAINLKETITDLYEKAYKKFMDYSVKLQKKEDQLGSMFLDRVNRLVKNESYHEKEKFLAGIEGDHEFSVEGAAGQKPKVEQLFDFTKEEQIKYTTKVYIPEILKQITAQTNKAEQTIQLLRHYDEINFIQFNEKKDFHAIVREITK